jgi:hypothetical protein
LTLCVDWNFIYGKFGSESEESEVENRHEVLYDEPRGYPRLTCISDECNHETLVRQPYMSDERYLQKKINGMRFSCARIKTANSPAVF